MIQILIAFDQLLNAIFGGYADETISARCWRLRHRQPYKFLRPVIDGLFFLQEAHCKEAHEAEIKRLQSPREQRQ